MMELRGMPDPASTPEVRNKPPMQFKRARIATSVFFGVLAVALCVLWVRSYWRWDEIYGPLMRLHTFSLSTAWGRVRFATFDRTQGLFTGVTLDGWGVRSGEIDERPSMRQLQLV